MICLTYTDAVGSAFDSFDVSETVRLERVNEGLIVAELFHGPTQAFKDLSMSVLAKLLALFLRKEVVQYFADQCPLLSVDQFKTSSNRPTSAELPSWWAHPVTRDRRRLTAYPMSKMSI